MNLIDRLNAGPVLCAEGYLFAMERRGYLQAGAYVPEVVLEHPEVVTQLHREFIRAGSDVVQAFTYYGHREKLRLIGKEELLEPLQRNALKIAKDAADEFPELDLMIAGNVANTNIYSPTDKQSHIDCQKMFQLYVLCLLYKKHFYTLQFFLQHIIYFHSNLKSFHLFRRH